MKLTPEQIERLLNRVDQSFSVPLSQKQNLGEFAKKLFEKATLCVMMENGEILSMVAGYTDCVVDRMAYISVVATLSEAKGRGLATQNMEKFLEICRQKKLAAVHLYTTPDNRLALALYQKLGFDLWNQKNEARPFDVHLIRYF